ncbi:uncharacterized protein BKA78DRAFT_328140 [Phyllosticta capitalensis]|uniref:uncharacterized protein n=1 Tax=Phyllosticta capitalensis TaxID=121624 RepID=UPI00312FA66A
MPRRLTLDSSTQRKNVSNPLCTSRPSFNKPILSKCMHRMATRLCCAAITRSSGCGYLKRSPITSYPEIPRSHQYNWKSTLAWSCSSAFSGLSHHFLVSLLRVLLSSPENRYRPEHKILKSKLTFCIYAYLLEVVRRKLQFLVQRLFLWRTTCPVTCEDAL